VQYTNSILRNQAATHRKRIFTSAGVPNFTELSDARITALRPLQVDDYGIIVIPTGVMVGRGKYLIIFFKFNTLTFSQSLHFTPRQVAKTASIAQLANRQTFPRYLLGRSNFRTHVCSAIPLGTSCHRNLSNSPVSLTFVNQFSYTPRLQLEGILSAAGLYP
jgi:hypothetical protein